MGLRVGRGSAGGLRSGSRGEWDSLGEVEVAFIVAAVCMWGWVSEGDVRERERSETRTDRIQAFMRMTEEDKNIQMQMMGAGCILAGICRATGSARESGGRGGGGRPAPNLQRL